MVQLMLDIFQGVVQMPWWAYVLVTLLLTHITIITVTVYLHRHMTHRALDLHPCISHFFRFWLWITTGIVTREWVAVHRKHHAKVESREDPHSPQIYGIKKVILEGSELYRKETAKRETLELYGHHCPDDWLEQNVYQVHTNCGIALMFLINFVLFGAIGITIWAMQMIWIPFFAAGIINGVGHWAGYRNFETRDTSTNIVPWGVLIGGEELHNNHHAFASAARFKNKWWEIDLGWQYISLLQFLKLARVKKMAPILKYNQHKQKVDLDTVKAVISNRWHIMSAYTRQVVSEVYKKEKSKLYDRASRKRLKYGKRLIHLSESRLSDRARQRLDEILETNHTMQTVYHFKQELQMLWGSNRLSHEQLIEKLQHWCQQAEASGIEALRDFANMVRGCTLQPV